MHGMCVCGWGQTFVVDSANKVGGRPLLSGGAVWGAQPVWGVKWHALSLALWGHRGPMEWSLGCSTEGNKVWRESTARLGLGRVWNEQARGALCVHAGWASWPEFHRQVPKVEVLAQVNQREAWGVVRLEARAALGQGLSLSGVTEEGLVRTARGAFGWSAWWKPTLDMESVGLPALGWSQGGAWHVAWGLDPKWWDGMRPWKPVPGRVYMQWTWPSGQWSLSWSGAVNSSAQAPTTQRARARRPSRRETIGVLFHRGARLHGSLWWWGWNRHTKDDS